MKSSTFFSFLYSASINGRTDGFSRHPLHTRRCKCCLATFSTLRVFQDRKMFVPWDHVYLRHLSTECRSILSANIATNTRPIYRPSLRLGRVSVNVNQQACRLTPGRYFTATQPILNQHAANITLTWSALAAEFYLLCSTERGFQRPSSFFGL